MTTLARKLMVASSSLVLLDVPVAASTYSDNAALTQHDIPLPSGSAAGNLALLNYIAHGSPTITAPSGSTTMITGSTPATYDSYRLFGKVLDATDISNGFLRVTPSTGSRAVATMHRVTGNRPGLVLNTDYAVSTEVNGNVSSIDPASLAPAWGSARNLWMAVSTGHDGSTALTSYPTGYGVSQATIIVGSGTGCAIAAACKLATASSDDPDAFVWAAARNRLAYTVAIRPQ